LSPASRLGAIAEHSLRFSAVCQMTGNSRLTSGGEAQSAHALSILLRHEERECKSKGENEMLLCRIVLKAYKNYFCKGSADFFVAPPDNNLRLELISGFFGVDERRALGRIRKIPPVERVALAAYKLAENASELYALVSNFDMRLERMWKIFKRLYADGGYGLTKYVDRSDAALSVALAADLKEKYTMLSYLKDAGFLENYLSDIAF
jgi:hypothetical protein